jgi:hypothetical protein
MKGASSVNLIISLILEYSLNNHFVHAKCRCKAATLSTLRFGERVKNIQNKPVINEITEDDVNGLSDQIRQLKVL